MKQYRILFLQLLLLGSIYCTATCPKNPEIESSQSVITITTTVTYGSGTTISDQIVIDSGGVLIITGTVTMNSSGLIKILNNGNLIVNGGTLQGAKVEMVSGGTLVVINNGTINRASDSALVAPYGANVYIYSGTVN